MSKEDERQRKAREFYDNTQKELDYKRGHNLLTHEQYWELTHANRMSLSMALNEIGGEKIVIQEPITLARTEQSNAQNNIILDSGPVGEFKYYKLVIENTRTSEIVEWDVRSSRVVIEVLPSGGAQVGMVKITSQSQFAKRPEREEIVSMGDIRIKAEPHAGLH